MWKWYLHHAPESLIFCYIQGRFKWNPFGKCCGEGVEAVCVCVCVCVCVHVCTLEKSYDIRYRTRNLPACSIVPQPTTVPVKNIIVWANFLGQHSYFSNTSSLNPGKLMSYTQPRDDLQPAVFSSSTEQVWFEKCSKSDERLHLNKKKQWQHYKVIYL
jgi:hypothetical protein